MLGTVNEKVLSARKSGDKFSTGVLQLVKAELLNNQKTDKPKDELEVVRSYAKKLGKSLEAYKGMAQYDELAKELDLVKTLLPVELSEQDIQYALSAYVFCHAVEKDPKSMGKLMGAMKEKLKGQEYDGALLSKVVKEYLS
jgi:uncharacterized protein YqeY